MKVLGSQLLRKATDDSDLIVSELKELIQEFQVQMIGPIRQEILSGIRVQAQFERLREHLRAFPDLPLMAEDYEEDWDRFRSNIIKGAM